MDYSTQDDSRSQQVNDNSTLEESTNVSSHEDHDVAKRVHRYYFVKHHKLRDPRLIEAHKIIEKLNEDHLALDTKRKEKLMYRDRVYRALRNLEYEMRQWKRDDFKQLQLILDKLQLSNNASRGRTMKPSSSTVKEIDKSSLHFSMLHGSNNLAEEKKILRKMNYVQTVKDSPMSLQDYDNLIWQTWWQTMRWNIRPDEKEQLFEKINALKHAVERDIIDAVPKGKMWNSLGPKETIVCKIKDLSNHLDEERETQVATKAKYISGRRKLEAVESELRCLERYLSNITKMKGEVYQKIHEWTELENERNASYDKYVSLKKDVSKLVENKDFSALCILSNREEENFLWNTNATFKDNYIKRSIESLNDCRLDRDGRRRNHAEKPIVVEDANIRTIKKWKRAIQRWQPIISKHKH